METTEFSLEGFTDYCKLKWSKPRLAKNLNWYRKAEPTDEFWDWYNGPDDKDKDYRKNQKEFLKKNGLSLYKEYGHFGLFDWNFKERGTKDDYKKQEKERDKILLDRLYPVLLEQVYRGTPTECTLNKRELDHCKTGEQMMDFAIHELVNGISLCDSVCYELSLE